GLVHLKGLTGLWRLDLSHTKTTDAGAAELKAALPRLKVIRFDRPPFSPSVGKGRAEEEE
ncbi:MAG: hypothetical protein ACYTFI_19980, partial [Planctomycetota bacterium]